MADLSPDSFPPAWADAWGDDRYGLWAQLRVGDVVQRMRWIEPGSFVMGSPDGKHGQGGSNVRKAEPGRDSDEGPQHTVMLTKGFWLADTACTQALWLAVLGGKNPSHVQGDPLKPVEQVSWDDVDGFCTALHSAVSLPDGTQAALPTEAQWEYACRAGTTTAYSFGSAVTREQVNMDHDQNWQERHKAKQTTVPVYALPANDWGLYQMHGNVWEWCADAMRTYTAEAVADPSGATGKEAEDFAVRGGSWIALAQRARSAQRYGRQRGRRNDDLGFRFALRSTAQPGGRRP